MIPERPILTLLNLGVDAITADTALLDDILSGSLEAAELAKAKTLFGTNPPRVIQGFPRAGATLPCYALTLASDAILQDYIGQGEEALYDLLDPDERAGVKFKRRITGVFTIFVYAEHPDVCGWLYRVLRRVVNLGTRWLEARGLADPVVTGADLAPDPRYTPENVYVRRLTLAVEYEDDWDDQDGLWTAIYGAPPSTLPTDGTVGIFHEDQPTGGMTPYVED